MEHWLDIPQDRLQPQPQRLALMMGLMALMYLKLVGGV